MLEVLKTAFELAFAPAAMIAVVSYFAKQFIEHARERDSRRRQHEDERDLEKFKVGLQNESFRDQQIQVRLLERRSEAISELRASIAAMNRSVSSLVHPFQLTSPDPDEETERKFKARKAAVDDFNAFADAFNKYDIYLPEQLDKKISNLRDTVRMAVVDFDFSQGINGEKADLKMWSEAHKTMQDAVPPIVAELKREFRSLLGVDSKS